MRLFTLAGALLLAGGAYGIISGAALLADAVSRGLFSPEVWAPAFWLANPGQPALGLSPNAQWLLRIAGGAASAALGARLVRATAGRED